MSQAATPKLIGLYLLMLAVHLAHVLEEVWGRFLLIDAAFGLGRFLIVNWLLWCIPAALLYCVLRGYRWAYAWSIVYAAIMVLNGIMHNAALLITGRYFGGFAGSYTGLALIVIGLLLIRALIPARRVTDQPHAASADEPPLHPAP
jgi:hypothetical protein